MATTEAQNLNSLVGILRETFRYFKSQSQLSENSEVVSDIKLICKALQATRGKVSKWKRYITKFNCFSLIAHHINIIAFDMIKFKTQSNNFVLNLNEIFMDFDELDAVLGNLKDSAKDVYLFCSNLKHINVSVITDLFDLPAQVSKYIRVGAEMYNSCEILEIKEAIQTLQFTDNINLPSLYVAIVGPSFMGKTQSAFTLAHIMNVFYVNFASILANDLPQQEIYSPFEKISSIFESCLDFDRPRTIKTKNTAKSIQRSSKSYRTLGLLSLLIRIDWPDSMDEKFLKYINLNNLIVPSMTITEFNNMIQEFRINLNNYVVFIDEMVDNVDLTKLLRNICRAVHIPVVLSGTNAKVQNLIGRSDISASRDDGVFPWVKVATKLPKATLKSFGPWISFNPLSDLNSLAYLDSFASSIGEMDYEELLGALLFRQDFTTDGGDWEFLKDLLKFTINQTRTNLPGLGIISLNILIELLTECRGKAQINRKMLSKSLVERIQQFVLKRKKNIKNVEGRIASAHILTFPSHLKDAHEVGEPAGQKVDSHLFFFGLPGDSGVFSLSAGIELEINQDVVVFERDNVSWRDHCFFPRISDDFFAHLVCWNAWFIKINGLEYSLAGLYEKYLNRPGLGVDSTAIVANSFSLELLAHWSACYASHLSVQGETLGVSFVGEFIKNLQVPPVSDHPVKINTIDLPDSIEEFLSDVTVPYLVPPNLISEEVVGSDFLKSVKSFINFGKSWRPANKVGWDVIFEASVGGLIKNCFIECKLWSRSIGLALIFKYYSRACDLGSPISFLVAKSFLKTLEDKFENVTDNNFANEPKAEDEDNEPLTPLAAMPINLVDKSEIAKAKKSIKAAPQTKKAKIPAISKESFIDLWKVPKNRINIYTVEPVINRFNNSISFNFRIIKEFDHPAGIFIITKSTFSPPSLSGSS